MNLPITKFAVKRLHMKVADNNYRVYAEMILPGQKSISHMVVRQVFSKEDAEATASALNAMLEPTVMSEQVDGPLITKSITKAILSQKEIVHNVLAESDVALTLLQICEGSGIAKSYIGPIMSGVRRTYKNFCQQKVDGIIYYAVGLHKLPSPIIQSEPTTFTIPKDLTRGWITPGKKQAPDFEIKGIVGKPESFLE